ncbi:MAG: methylmalonyl Co-A mutase-associated GTPase MeaB [Desulfobacterales bacterium]|jgi:LAO/AO transport system kinase|nr:methylmalonyl Co-A mutase-associated GTPase MeaB [Desulfobacterales bacterium]
MKQPDAKTCIDGVLAGDRRMLAKAITLVESALPAHRETARKILGALLPKTGGAVRLGITGVPGVGKSTFIESFGMMLLEKGHRVAVLAVDPSSARSGGSLMADKTRMERLSADRRAFIRPSPSGGTLGGVARKTRETMLVCEAAGYDVIVVETVGVGQSETAVASMVDFFLVLLLAGAGDELQGLKKGILELADALAVNKADGDNRGAARKAARTYELALHLLQPSSPRWNPPVLTCSALETSGIDEIWQTVLRHRDVFLRSGELEEKRRQQAVAWMWSLVDEGLKERFARHPDVKRHLPHILRAVERGRLAPTAAADTLLFSLDNHFQT